MRIFTIIIVTLVLLSLIVGCAKKAAEPEVSTVTPSAMPSPKVQPEVKPTVSDAKMITTKSGLKYQDLKVGNGASPKAGDLAVVNYTGWLKDGTIFDSTKGKQPFSFKIGKGEVIKGWDEGVATMKVGGIRKLIIPPDLAYGPDGTPGGPIPQFATLTFEIELIDIVPAD